MRLALAVLLCAFSGLSAAQAQYVPGFAPGFRPGFQFIGGGGFPAPGAVVDYDFKNARYSGPAISVSNASGGYVDDVAGNWTLVPPNTLRRSNKGVLIEGAQTNSIRNNSMQGAVAGSPGTLPTNWASAASANGITRQIAGIGTENGIDYIDFRFSGTATASASMNMDPDTPAAAASGQLWTSSAFAKFISGPAPGVTFNIQTAERGGTTTPNTVVTFTPTGAALGTQRVMASRTLSVSDTTGVQQRIFAIIPSGAVVDFTLRIGWPQLEQWSTAITTVGGASSPIRTTGTAAARAADVVTANPSLSSAGYTLAGVASQNILRPFAGLGQVYSSTSSNSLLVDTNGTPNGIRVEMQTTSGTSGNTGSVTVASMPTRFAFAGAGAAGDYAVSANGAAPVTGTAAGFPVQPLDRISVGSYASNGQHFGYIERLAIYPYRAANSNLQQLSTLANWGG